MPTSRIHLVNPKAESFTTQPIFFNRALYSPLAGLLAVAGLIPQDEYEVVLTDENNKPRHLAEPPLLPQRAAWRDLVLNIHY